MTTNPPTACDGCQRAESAEKDLTKIKALVQINLHLTKETRAECDSLARQIALHAGDIASEANARVAAEERAEEAEEKAADLLLLAHFYLDRANKNLKQCDALRAQLAESHRHHGAVVRLVLRVGALVGETRCAKAAADAVCAEIANLRTQLATARELLRDCLRRDDEYSAGGNILDHDIVEAFLAEKDGGR
jgi:hypothetical protein